MKRNTSIPRVESSLKLNRKQQRRLNLHYAAFAILFTVAIVMFTSIWAFLGALHSVDAHASTNSNRNPSINIKALHVIQQKRAGALKSSLREESLRKLPPCLNFGEDLDLLLQFNPLNIQQAAQEDGEEISAWHSFNLNKREFRKGNFDCISWGAEITEIHESKNIKTFLLSYDFTIKQNDNKSTTPKKEAWNNSEILDALSAIEPAKAAIVLSRSSSDSASPSAIWRVESFPSSADERRDAGPLTALVSKEAVSFISLEICQKNDHALSNSSFFDKLELNVSFWAPKNSSKNLLLNLPDSLQNLERKLFQVKKRCQLWHRPALHLTLPPRLEEANGQVLPGMSFPMGQLAITWESNCNSVLHSVAICKGELGPCMVKEPRDCQVADDPKSCEMEEISHNRTKTTQPDFVVSETNSFQVASNHWLHTARFPRLSTGIYRYKVRSGGRWSPLFHFRVPPPPLLQANFSRTETPKKSEPKRKRQVSRFGKAQRVGTKSALSRKAYERGPIGVSPIGQPGAREDWVHVAVIGDSECGSGGTFRRHLAHMWSHKPHPDAIIHLGDRVKASGNVADWLNCWHVPLVDSGIGPNSPHFGPFGDNDNSIALDEGFSPFLGSKKSWFSFVFGNALWIVLDSSLPPKVNSVQHNWLRQMLVQLSISRAMGLAPSFAIVLVHVPPFVDYWEPPLWKKSEREKSAFLREEWVPLFEKYKVDLVISGHSHVYQRGERNGVMYAIVGGGGGQLDKRVVENWSMYKSTHLGHHYVWMDISHHKLSWTAYDSSNNPIDHGLFEPENFPQ